MKRMLCLLLLWLSLATHALADSSSSADRLYSAIFNGLDGKPVPMSQLKGKVAVVNFWATWCPPCRREIPDLVEVHHKYQSDKVVFVGIAVDDNTELVKEFAKAYDIDYLLVTGRDKGIELLQAQGNAAAALPFTLVLDAQGGVVASRRGLMDMARLEKALQTALGKSE